MNINEYFQEYRHQLDSIVDSSLAEKELANDITLCFNIVNDYEAWLNSIGNRLESIIYNNAIKVYQDAFGCMLEGHYQSAFMGLRYCFERTLCGIYLSANEIELRTWLNGLRDTYWTEIIGKEEKQNEGEKTNEGKKTENDKNIEKGLFSKKFVDAFFPELQDEIRHFKRMAVSVYRECSEFVHGNLVALEKIPEHLTYDNKLVSLWCEKALVMKRVIYFAFTLRYLRDMAEGDKSRVADIIKDEFMSVKPIIELF